MDCWALGCILGELLQHEPLLPGKTEVGQLELIVHLLGSPTEAIWPGLPALPLAAKITLPQQPYSNLKEKVSLWERERGG